MVNGDPGAESVYFWDQTRKGVDRRGAGPMDASVYGRGAGEGFGVMGLAPVEADMVDSIPPSYTGGNIDNWRIGKGATLYYPVAVPGALWSVGDPHASQGDSEQCGTAIVKKAIFTGEDCPPQPSFGRHPPMGGQCACGLGPARAVSLRLMLSPLQ